MPEHSGTFIPSGQHSNKLRIHVQEASPDGDVVAPVPVPVPVRPAIQAATKPATDARSRMAAK